MKRLTSFDLTIPLPESIPDNDLGGNKSHMWKDVYSKIYLQKKKKKEKCYAQQNNGEIVSLINIMEHIKQWKVL